MLFFPASPYVREGQRRHDEEEDKSDQLKNRVLSEKKDVFQVHHLQKILNPNMEQQGEVSFVFAKKEKIEALKNQPEAAYIRQACEGMVHFLKKMLRVLRIVFECLNPFTSFRKREIKAKEEDEIELNWVDLKQPPEERKINLSPRIKKSPVEPQAEAKPPLSPRLQKPRKVKNLVQKQAPKIAKKEKKPIVLEEKVNLRLTPHLQKPLNENKQPSENISPPKVKAQAVPAKAQQIPAKAQQIPAQAQVVPHQAKGQAAPPPKVKSEIHQLEEQIRRGGRIPIPKQQWKNGPGIKINAKPLHLEEGKKVPLPAPLITPQKDLHEPNFEKKGAPLPSPVNKKRKSLTPNLLQGKQGALEEPILAMEEQKDDPLSSIKGRGTPLPFHNLDLIFDDDFQENDFQQDIERKEIVNSSPVKQQVENHILAQVEIHEQLQVLPVGSLSWAAQKLTLFFLQSNFQISEGVFRKSAPAEQIREFYNYLTTLKSDEDLGQSITNNGVAIKIDADLVACTLKKIYRELNLFGADSLRPKFIKVGEKISSNDYMLDEVIADLKNLVNELSFQEKNDLAALLYVFQQVSQEKTALMPSSNLAIALGDAFCFPKVEAAKPVLIQPKDKKTGKAKFIQGVKKVMTLCRITKNPMPIIENNKHHLDQDALMEYKIFDFIKKATECLIIHSEQILSANPR